MSNPPSPKPVIPVRRRTDHRPRRRHVWKCPITRSSRSSKATAPAPTSGAPACACSTPRSTRSSAARRRSPGPRSTPARRRKKLFDNWLPDETLEAFKKYFVGIKGPLTTPVGGGIRSLNVAIRQMLDLYVCLRPVRYFKGVPSPVKAPGEGRHGDLPREHRGHLRRHRVGRRVARGEEGHRVPAERDGREEDPLPGDVRHRHQAGLARGHRAPDPRRARLRASSTSARASRWSTRATS